MLSYGFLGRPIALPRNVERLLCRKVANACKSTTYLVEKLSQQPIRSFSINDIFKHTAKTPNNDWVCTSANWIKKEIAVRLAHRLHDFDRLPHVVVANMNIACVYELYITSFEQTYHFGGIRGISQAGDFTQLMRGLLAAHSEVISLMAAGVSELQISHPDIILDDFLNLLFVTRIGSRVLTEHHIWAFDKLKKVNVDCQGVISRNVRPAEILKNAAAQVSQSSLAAYGVAPRIDVTGDLQLFFPYIPELVSFVVHELLKNSVRSTVEHHLGKSELPPIQVSIYKGNSEIFIKIFDQGGGIPPHASLDVWKFGYTTARDMRSTRATEDDQHISDKGMSGMHIEERAILTSSQEFDDGRGDEHNFGLGFSAHSGSSVMFDMAGYGFGLPLSRLYTRYFGGDLDLKSMPGIGTDTYVLLPRLGNQREINISCASPINPHQSRSSPDIRSWR